MALVAGEQATGGEVRDNDGRLIVVGPGGVAIGGGGGGTGADPLSDGTPGGALPSKTLWVAGADGTILRGIAVDASGHVLTAVQNFPASQAVSDGGGSLTVDGTVTANAGTGPWPVTDNGGTLSVDDGAGSLTVDGSVSVSNFPATQPVSGSVNVGNFPASQPVTGPLTDAQLRASAVPVSGTFFQATQPVSLAAVPTVTEKQDQPASTTATWTSATALNTALTNSSVTGYGTATVTIQTPSTATAGAITVEGTDDGTVWYPLTPVRVDNGLQENPVLLAGPGVAQTRMYATSVDAMTGIRARLSTVIVGTGNTIVRMSLIAGGIEPAVSLAPPRNPVTIYIDQAAGIIAEALATVTIQRGDAAATTGTTYTPTAGKTFRLLSAHFNGAASGAAMVAIKVRVRGLQAGTASATSPIRLNTSLRFPTTTAAAGTGVLPVTMEGAVNGLLDVPPGGSLGVTHVAGAATYLLDVTLVGYEL